MEREVVVASPLGRCAAHPARPAYQRCPTCDRPRCGADAEAYGSRCAVCAEAPATVVPRPALVAVTAAAVGGPLVAVVGAAVGQEYVGARFFAVIVPALVGFVLAAVAVGAAGALRPPLRHGVAALAAVLGAVSALLSFVFTQEPYGPAGRWLPPVVAGAAAAAAAVEVLAKRVRQDRNVISTMPPR